MSRTPLAIGVVLVAGVLVSAPLRRAGHALLLRTTGTVVRNQPAIRNDQPALRNGGARNAG